MKHFVHASARTHIIRGYNPIKLLVSEQTKKPEVRKGKIFIKASQNKKPNKWYIMSIRKERKISSPLGQNNGSQGYEVLETSFA